MNGAGLTWGRIVRLGLVQTALGAIVVLMTATLNRVMVVELALPALAPGLLVALFHGVQILRPAWGYRSDVGGRRTPWIVGGMATLAIGGVAGGARRRRSATSSPPLRASRSPRSASCWSAPGAGAAGTNVLATLAAHVAPGRRAAAATTVWVMMIFGFALTAPLAGHFLDPYSPTRLVAVVGGRLPPSPSSSPASRSGASRPRRRKPQARPAGHALPRRVRARSGRSRRRGGFTIFIFVSMLAYSARGIAGRTLRRPRVRPAAGRHDQACGPPARRRARRHDPGRDLGLRHRRTPARRPQALDGRRLPRLGGGAAGRRGGGLAGGRPGGAARRRVRARGSATASTPPPRSAR